MNTTCSPSPDTTNDAHPCENIAEVLNRECHCLNIDPVALRNQLDHVLGDSHVPGSLIEARPHLFADFGVFATQWQVDQMSRLIRTIEQVIAMPAYQEAVLKNAPEIARHLPGAQGVFYGYDFHLSAQGPHLVEINTNSGGAMLNTVLAKAQLACCDEVRDMMDGPVPIARLDETLFAMFASEWERSAIRTTPLKTIAIVDTRPEEQYLYPEFLLFQDLFARHGVQALILDPGQLEMRKGALWHGELQIDLVYNRLTDFDLGLPAHQALRDAYLTSAAVITPHPHGHALYADKRNLVLLTDATVLHNWGVDPALIEILLQGIPKTVLVTADNADALWASRKQLFFKPAQGFGSRAVYRGDKLTKRVWGDILTGEYVAQALVAPSERRLPAGTETETDTKTNTIDLKLDVRCYVYAGAIQLLAARMYQGQTTNFRTAGGGFAPIYTVPCLPSNVGLKSTAA